MRFPKGDLERFTAVSRACTPLLPEPRQATEAEIRAAYEAALQEAECLRGLGYEANPAPTFETFRATWDTGPWSSISGIDTNSWTAAEYHTAKSTCTLATFIRDVRGP